MIIINSKTNYKHIFKYCIFMNYIHKIVGYVLLNSKEYKHSNKQGYTKKKFLPFYSVLIGPFWVNVKIIKANKEENQFAIINCVVNSNNEIDYSIDQYIGNNINDLPKKIAMCNWHRIQNTFLLKESISEIDLTPNRIDLTNVYSISVDPIGSTDIDDAIGVCKVNELLYDIYIHIADPTSYLIEKSYLDKEVSNRIESIYLSNETHHMFPLDIVHNLFSLNADSIRRSYSMVASILINDSFDDFIVKEYYVKKANVKIKYNYSYEEVDSIISKNNDNIIFTLYDIGKIIYKKYVNADLTEYNSKKMIEGYMVMCNYLAAKLMTCNHNEFSIALLKVQPTTNLFLTSSNINSEYLNIHKNLQYNCAKFIIQKNDNMVLNTEHASLKLDVYTNFTSPIRRYSDIIVHRLLYKLSNNVSEDLLFKLNFYKQLYKKVYKYDKLLLIYNDLIKHNCEDIVFKISGIVVDIKYNSKGDIVLKIIAKNILNTTVPTTIKNNIINMIHSIKLIDNVFMKLQLNNYSLSFDDNSNIQSVNVAEKKYQLFCEYVYNLCILKNGFCKFIGYFPSDKI